MWHAVIWFLSAAGDKNGVPEIGTGTAVLRDLQGEVASLADDFEALPKSGWRLFFFEGVSIFRRISWLELFFFAVIARPMIFNHSRNHSWIEFIYYNFIIFLFCSVLLSSWLGPFSRSWWILFFSWLLFPLWSREGCWNLSELHLGKCGYNPGQVAS